MDKKQKEALIIALAEKGETYRDITKKAGVCPNTIKVVLNRVLTNLLLYSLESSNSFQKGRLLYK
jgi:lambda repressor-like predicted transcriptional regulator